MIKKIFDFIKNNQLIIFLALIAILMFGYRLLGSKQATSVPTVTPTPSPTKAPENPYSSGRGISEEAFVKKLLEQFPLTPYLPYPGKEFSVVYTAPLSLEITLKQADNSLNRQKALDWIKKQKIDPQTHTIVWK